MHEFSSSSTNIKMANEPQLLCDITVYRYLHGCNVLYDLVKPWANTNSIVVADSYYASVQASLRLYSIGLRFIGTVKTSTREFPMAYLASRIMNDGRGDRHGVLSKDLQTGALMLAYCWVDRER